MKDGINEESFRKAFPNLNPEFADKYFKKKDNPVKAPSLATQAINFGKALFKHIADGLRNVSEEVYKKRIELCESCDKFDKEKRRCSECGCYIDTKCGWASEECPLKKWLKDQKKEGECGCAK